MDLAPFPVVVPLESLMDKPVGANSSATAPSAKRATRASGSKGSAEAEARLRAKARAAEVAW